MTSRPVRAAVFLIQLYRTTISPLRLPTCRFTPTCSQYAVEALTEFGLLRGGWLALVRLLKCGPWHNGGWDPIPDRGIERERHSDATAEGSGGAAEDRGEPVQQGKSLPRV
ncbi:MAG: membrane protein insertion efficiency factor YidD [Mycolicibacterium rufum]|uniref:Putative membrane protein insertion efficiency factor n=2 Tax=Mycolicibacterium TaxID=1866885 RepID=A0A0J6VTA6_MYCCU|nr:MULTISPECIES: membrane protein insertion efficiency factor YidD [Mycolicibacterium]MBI5341641.1 membrane protein insertion efficiency factor YidD [Mycolicibacterium rufum]KMO70523.1 putative membrane protein insertion efficiency factor [Mycolicibacterium chlorophenolicum]KMO73414.1 putative membrane protein insertion efficiency factor [Mycolicibacterium chubuense]ORA56611.1 membrane protein insertion efficiency factor YidD [Mycolicibacterium chubuense]SPX98948.1 Putative membrane protein in